MHRGLEIEFHLRPGLTEENFVAEVIANVAAFRLEEDRGETLRWQVVRVETSGSHHYRLLVGHPEHLLDLGIRQQLKRLLDELSNETTDELRHRLQTAEREGLRRTGLRHVHESADLWRDDFWNWIG